MEDLQYTRTGRDGSISDVDRYSSGEETYSSVSQTTLNGVGSNEASIKYMREWLTVWYQQYQDQSGKDRYLQADREELKAIYAPKFEKLLTNTAVLKSAQQTQEPANITTTNVNGASEKSWLDNEIEIGDMKIPVVLIAGVVVLGFFMMKDK